MHTYKVPVETGPGAYDFVEHKVKARNKAHAARLAEKAHKAKFGDRTGILISLGAVRKIKESVDLQESRGHLIMWYTKHHTIKHASHSIVYDEDPTNKDGTYTVYHHTSTIFGNRKHRQEVVAKSAFPDYHKRMLQQGYSTKRKLSEEPIDEGNIIPFKGRGEPARPQDSNTKSHRVIKVGEIAIGHVYKTPEGEYGCHPYFGDIGHEGHRNAKEAEEDLRDMYGERPRPKPKGPKGRKPVKEDVTTEEPSFKQVTGALSLWQDKVKKLHPAAIFKHAEGITKAHIGQHFVGSYMHDHMNGFIHKKPIAEVSNEPPGIPHLSEEEMEEAAMKPVSAPVANGTVFGNVKAGIDQRQSKELGRLTSDQNKMRNEEPTVTESIGDHRGKGKSPWAKEPGLDMRGRPKAPDTHKDPGHPWGPNIGKHIKKALRIAAIPVAGVIGAGTGGHYEIDMAHWKDAALQDPGFDPTDQFNVGLAAATNAAGSPRPVPLNHVMDDDSIANAGLAMGGMAGINAITGAIARRRKKRHSDVNEEPLDEIFGIKKRRLSRWRKEQQDRPKLHALYMKKKTGDFIKVFTLPNGGFQAHHHSYTWKSRPEIIQNAEILKGKHDEWTRDGYEHTSPNQSIVPRKEIKEAKQMLLNKKDPGKDASKDKATKLKGLVQKKRADATGKAKDDTTGKAKKPPFQKKDGTVDDGKKSPVAPEIVSKTASPNDDDHEPELDPIKGAKTMTGKPKDQIDIQPVLPSSIENKAGIRSGTIYAA